MLLQAILTVRRKKTLDKRLIAVYNTSDIKWRTMQKILTAICLTAILSASLHAQSTKYTAQQILNAVYIDELGNPPAFNTQYSMQNIFNAVYNDTNALRVKVTGGGDNLGNHIATQTLNMATYGISNAGAIGAASFTGPLTGAASLNVLKAGDNMSGQLTTFSTITVQGSAFSVGGSTLVVKEGNVGIGTINPSKKLDVNGEIQVSTINMVATGSILFVEGSSSTIGQYQANRPNEIFVTSRIVVGNSFIIKSDSIFSTTLNSDIISVSTSVMMLAQNVEIKGLQINEGGLRSKGKGQFASDIEIGSSNRGMILTSINNKKYLVWVDDNGTVFTTLIASSPEISQAKREELMAAKRNEIKAERYQIQISTAITLENLDKRLKIVERLLKLK